MSDHQMEIIVLLSGRDDTLADTIYARHSYTAEQIVWNQRFVDVISLHSSGRFLVDLRRFNDTEPVKITIPA
jgi:inward rectifier potassium channel